MQEVQEYCVRNPEWQRFRESLKGEVTGVKLDRLAGWYDLRIDRYPRATTVQVDNYINALRRGGFLDQEGRVLK